MGVGQLIRNVITAETDPTVANFTKSLTSNNTILTAVNAATGTISASVLPSYVDDVLNFANLAAFPVAGETGKIYVTEDNNKTYRWSGSVYVEISSSATAGEALKLTNARTISTTGDITGSISGFDGSANVSGVMTLQTVNSDVGSFGSVSAIPVVTVNAKGQVTAVSTNSIGNELIAIQALADTAGFLKKTGDGNYSIDNNNYLPLSGGTVTGDLVSTSATASTSTTTGAIRAASLGVTGAIFANTVSANSYNLIPVGRGAGGVNSNTVIGVSSLQANTTGTNCSAFGVQSLRSNTTGTSCSAFGVSSLLANTTGANCSAFGVDSLRTNTTGTSCSAFGAYSLLANTTGANCSAFGVNAGRFQPDGVTEISVTNNSCFIGTSTKGTQNATNENVFGFNATGNGSNTVTIGDNNIVRTYLKGVVDVANTTPSTSTTTGGLVVSGGVGVGGAVFARNLYTTGNTGIGTGSPAANLHVSTNPSEGTIQLGGTAATGYYSQIYQDGNFLDFIANGDQALRVGLGTNNGTGNIRFFTAGWLAGNTERMRITADGNVGIGTGSPSQKLDIDGSAKATSFVVGTNQVVSSRKSGWVAPTGTPTRTTFATSTVTLPQLAERVKALIDDLTTHGLIGT